MIKSMTGYGKELLQLPSKKITIEIKSLNSKQLDLNVRMPQYYRSKEMRVRQLLSKSVVRGKVEFSMYAEITGVDDSASINKELAIGYIKQLKEIAQETNVEGDLIAAVMKMPEVLRNEREEIDEEEWSAIEATIIKAIETFDQFRIDEGKSLKKDLDDQIAVISELLEEVAPYENERIETLRSRILNQLNGIEEGFDKNRFEQEMIFYLEKLDINEEKVRLSNHLNYFRENVNSPESNGKKLGFISQEIGREVNTLGSKANHAQIQKLVVQMKEALEKIKEQVLNAI